MEHRDPRREMVQRIMEDTQQAMQLSNQAMQRSNQAMQHMQQAMHRILRLILHTEEVPPPQPRNIETRAAVPAAPRVATGIARAEAVHVPIIDTIEHEAWRPEQTQDDLVSSTARQEPAQIISTIPETQPQEVYHPGQQDVMGVVENDKRIATPPPRNPWSQTPTEEWFTLIEDRPKSVAGDVEITTVCTRCFNMWLKRIRTEDDIPDCVFDRTRRKKCEYCSRQRNQCTLINPQLTQRLLRYKQRMEDPERTIDEAGNDWEEFKKQYARVRTMLARDPIAEEEESKRRGRVRSARKRAELKSRRHVEQKSVSEEVTHSQPPFERQPTSEETMDSPSPFVE